MMAGYTSGHRLEIFGCLPFRSRRSLLHPGGLVLGLDLNNVVGHGCVTFHTRHVLPFRSSDLEQDPLLESQILFSFPAPQIAVLFSLQLVPFSAVLYM